MSLTRAHDIVTASRLTGVALTIALGIVIGWASVYFQLLWLAGGLGGLALAVIIFRNPWHGVLLLVFFLPFERLGAIEMSGMTIRASQVTALLLCVSVVFNQLRARRFDLPRNPALFPVALFFMVSLVGLLHTPNLHRSVLVLIVQLCTASLLWLVPLVVRDERRLPQLMRWLLAATLVVTVFGLFQFLGDWIGLSPDITGLRLMYTKEILGFPRIQSTALEPLYFANYLLIPLAILISLFFSKSKTFPQWWVVGLLGLALLNLVLTVARGGYLAFVPVVGVLVLYYVRQVFTVRFAVWVSAAVLIAGIGASQVMDLGAVTQQFTSHVTQLFVGASYAERVDTISSAFAAWRTHPLVGIGPGAFGPWYAAYPLTTPAGGWNIVNNEYIELLAEHGVLGLGAFLLLCAVLIVRSVKALRAPGYRDVKILLIALLAAFIGILVQYNTFSVLYIMHIWCVMGLLVALQNMILFPHREPRV